MHVSDFNQIWSF